jgi:adenylate cyclase
MPKVVPVDLFAIHLHCQGRQKSPKTMKWKSRLILRESTFTAIAFTAAAYSYYLMAFWGIQDHFSGGPLKEYMTGPFVHVELLLVGLLFGVLIGVINRITDTPRFRNKPVGLIIMFRTILYLVSLGFVAGLVFVVFIAFIFPQEVLVNIYDAITPKYGLSVILWIILVVGGINFMLEIERIIGPGNIWRLFIGRYRRPRVEERVFLFIDLKGSTAIAEKLGHHRYSELLQECYRDLTQVVIRYEAAIYQYVGDEVVMSWPGKEKDIQKRASVHTFFDYQMALLHKNEEYIERFGIAPEFRGGIDVGAVTVIEVGDVKREIVYHGDVLNTAARLLELCKERNNKLVVSRAVGDAVEQEKEIHTSWSEKVSLRGKRELVAANGLQSNGIMA